MCRGTTVNYISAAWRNADEEMEIRMMEKILCRKCRSLLTSDEIAMTKKLINRGTEVFYCLDCLALAFDVEREDLERKILEFRESGCTLFA